MKARTFALSFLAAVLASLSLGAKATAATPTFATSVPERAPNPVFTTAIGPAIGDFDGDSVPDFATIDGAGSAICLSLGNADGTMKSTTTYPGPANPVAVLAADLDDDGRTDLVVATETTLTYYLNDGTAPFPFSTAVNVTLGIRAVTVAVADFDQDGYLDFILSGDGDNGAGQTIGKLQTILSLAPGGSFGGYDTPIQYDAGVTAGRAAVGDLNGDGYPDVAVARQAPAEYGGGDVTVFFGNPNSFTTNFLTTPQTPVALVPTHHPVGIEIADVTQDEKADILLTTYNYPPGAGGPLVLSYVDLLRNRDDDVTAPTLQSGEYFYFDYGVDSTPPLSDLKIGDIDGDGVRDIAVIDSLGVALHVFRVSAMLDGNSVYQSLHVDAEDTFPINHTARTFALGKLNNDTYPDAVIAHGAQGGVTTLINTTPLTEAGPIGKAIQFGKGAYTALEGFPAPMDVLIKRASDSTGTVTVKFTVGGTATPNGSPKSDFMMVADNQPFAPRQTTGTLTFGPAEFEKHLNIMISNDAGSEPDETIIVTLQTPAGEAVLGTPRVATITIKDSEPPALKGGNQLKAKPGKALKLTAADKLAGVKISGRTPEPWTFTTTETRDAKAPGLAIKVQYSLTPAPNEVWVDLEEGVMSRPGNKGTKWVATSTKVPNGDTILFRTVSTAANFTAGSGPAAGPCHALASPFIKLTMKAEPESDVSFNSMTHPEEGITYKVTYKNTGTVPANNVTVAVQIPVRTHSDNGTGSPDIQFIGNGSASESVAAYFDLGTVGPGSGGTRSVNVIVDPDLLDGKQPAEPPLIGFGDSRAKVFKGLADFAKRGKDAVYGALWDDPVPATKPKPLYSGGTALTTPVLQPIGITVVADKTIVGVGDTVTYTVTLNNYSSLPMQNVVFRNTVPVNTALEGVFPNDGNDNFIGTPLEMNPMPGQNPSVTPFQFGLARTMTWTIAQFPAHATRVIKFTVRTLYDVDVDYVDAAGVHHTPEITNTNYGLSAVRPSGRSFAVEGLGPGEKLFRSLISNDNPGAAPQLRLEKEARGEGKGRGELRNEPGFLGDVETVLPYDDVTYAIHYKNTGDASLPDVSLARNCVLQEEIAEDSIFNGGVKFGTTDIPLPDPRVVLRDYKGRVLPYAGDTIEQNFGFARVIEFRIGDIPPDAKGQVSYLSTPQLGAGKYIRSRDCRIWTASLRRMKYCQEQVVVKVVKPISFFKNVTRDKSDSPPIPAGSLLTYTVEIRNNGGIEASNVVVDLPLPKGTAYQPGSGQSLDPRVPVNVITEGSQGRTSKVSFVIASLHASEQTSTPDPDHPDNVRLSLQVTLDNPFPTREGAVEGTFDIVANVKGQYPSGAVTLRGNTGVVSSLLSGALVTVPDGFDYNRTRVTNSPGGSNLWAFKQYPQFVSRGQKMVYTIGYGNSGSSPLTSARVEIQIPAGTTLDRANTSPDFEEEKGTLRWRVGDLAPNSSGTVFLVVDVLPGAAFPRDLLVENSCSVETGTFVFNGEKLVRICAVPGPARTIVFAENPFVAAWQLFCSILQGLGANLSGDENPAIEEGVQQFNAGSVNVTLRGVDTIVLENGVFVIQNGAGNIVAAGGGNLIAGGNIVAAGGGNIVAAGGGNLVGQDGASIVAAGGGNIVAAGGGNFISVQGIGLCNQDNMLAAVRNIVAGGGGNIVAAGGGNLIRIENGVASLVGLDGASLRDNLGQLLTIDRLTPNALDAGGGNIVAGGGGNVLSPGSYNLDAPLLAGKEGAALIINPNGAGAASIAARPSLEKAKVVANDGAGVVANDGAGVISDKGAGVVANDGAGLTGKDVQFAPVAQ